MINALTQEELASRADLTKGYISQLENDATSPSIATLKDIVDVFGITMQEFFAESSKGGMWSSGLPPGCSPRMMMPA